MKAAVVEHYKEPLIVENVTEPTHDQDGVLVEVKACGVCRSDWHGWLGHDTDIVGFPHIPGHEFAGSVESVGDGVDRGWVGRRAAAPFVQGRPPVGRS